MTPELEMVLSADNVATSKPAPPPKAPISEKEICHICNTEVEFKVKEDYDKHMNEVHGYTYNCKYCKKWYLSDYKLREHLKKYHNVQTQFQCYFCDEKSENMVIAKAHYKAEHLFEELINNEAFYLVCVENDVRVSFNFRVVLL